MTRCSDRQPFSRADRPVGRVHPPDAASADWRADSTAPALASGPPELVTYTEYGTFTLDDYHRLARRLIGLRDELSSITSGSVSLGKTDIHLDDREIAAVTRPVVQAVDRLTAEVKLLREAIAGAAIGLARVQSVVHRGEPGPEVPVPKKYRRPS